MPFITDDTNSASFEAQNGKLQSPSICSVPHKATSKPFPKILQSPFLEVSFSGLTTFLLWKWYCWCQDVCSPSSAHCFGFQRQTNYLDCLSPSYLFIFPEISPPRHGDWKITVCLIYPCPGLKHQRNHLLSGILFPLTPTSCCETHDVFNSLNETDNRAKSLKTQALESICLGS